MDIKEAKWSEQIKSLWGLFIVATPIGHIEDISYRALITLQNAKKILCEDTRETKQLLKYYDIYTPCESYHAHNERQKLNRIISWLKEHQILALVSDRGTPLISDPGYLLTQQCYLENIPVHGIPGASALLSAIILSGIACHSFYFQGFLPHKKRTLILGNLSALSVPVIFFESPHRLNKTLKEIYHIFGERKACLLKELTKKFENRTSAALSHLIQLTEKKVLGEYVLVIEGKTPLGMYA